MEGIKYVNLIAIGLVVIEIRGIENGELAVPVNNTLAHPTAFLAADARPCVLILVCVRWLATTYTLCLLNSAILFCLVVIT